MSSSRKPILLIGTHLAALVAGLLIFRPASTSEGGNQQAKAHPANAADAASAASGAEQGSAATKAPARSNTGPGPSVHLLAWKALAHDGLTRPERMKASAVILRQWVKEDWQAALDTVMKETPDDFALLSEFNGVFADKAVEMWSVIESKRYGLSTMNLRGAWLQALRRLDAEQLACIEKELPENAREGLRPPKPPAPNTIELR